MHESLSFSKTVRSGWDPQMPSTYDLMDQEEHNLLQMRHQNEQSDFFKYLHSN